MKRRSGYTLIEMLVVIAGSGVVLATATGLMHSMFKADQAARDRAASQQTLRRLADDFRDDAHAAVKLSAVATKGAAGARERFAWELQMSESDGKVRYEAVPGRVVREEQAAGKVVRREAYRLPDGSAVTIGLESGPPALAVLHVAAAGPAEGHSGGLPLRVDAALASDHRFDKLGGK